MNLQVGLSKKYFRSYNPARWGRSQLSRWESHIYLAASSACLIISFPRCIWYWLLVRNFRLKKINRSFVLFTTCCFQYSTNPCSSEQEFFVLSFYFQITIQYLQGFSMFTIQYANASMVIGTVITFFHSLRKSHALNHCRCWFFLSFQFSCQNGQEIFIRLQFVFPFFFQQTKSNLLCSRTLSLVFFSTCFFVVLVYNSCHYIEDCTFTQHPMINGCKYLHFLSSFWNIYLNSNTISVTTIGHYY